LSLALCAVPAAAESGASIHKVGVIKVSKLFEEYEGTKSSDAQLEQMSSAKQGEREKLVSEIKGMRDELVLLNDESRLERQRAIEEKIKGLAEFDRSAKDTLRKHREESLKKILDEIEGTVAKYSKENGFELVLSDRAVLYGIDALDITSEVLTILNEQYKKRRAS